MEANQAIRMKITQKELQKHREAFNEFKRAEKLRLVECERNEKEFKPSKFHYMEARLENREPPLELVARSRYPLFKFPHQLKPKQKIRVNVLFRLYPEIEQAIDLGWQFRDFVSKKNIGFHYLQIDKQLHDWYEKVENVDIDEMLNFKSMIESNEGYVVNYFIHGETNALAERINSKIQKFISFNQGTRDKDFFIFRLSNCYA